MKDLKRFATEDFPLHPSGLKLLVECPWRLVMLYLDTPDGESGPAADTGSAVHAAVSALHQGKEVAESIGVMSAKIAEYPRADLVDAADLFLKYVSDPRNRAAEIVLNEQPLKFQIAAAPEDPTGEPLIFVGRVDQVRRIDRLKVYDIKTSKMDPTHLLHESLFQMAAYCVGASVLLNERVDPGALILVRKYKATDHANAPVFWHFPWTFNDCAQILNIIRHRVAEVRRGILYHNPSETICRWCHQRTPDVCFPKLQEELQLREVK